MRVRARRTHPLPGIPPMGLQGWPEPTVWDTRSNPTATGVHRFDSDHRFPETGDAGHCVTPGGSPMPGLSRKSRCGSLRPDPRRSSQLSVQSVLHLAPDSGHEDRAPRPSNLASPESGESHARSRLAVGGSRVESALRAAPRPPARRLAMLTRRAVHECLANLAALILAHSTKQFPPSETKVLDLAPIQPTGEPPCRSSPTCR